MSTTNLNTALPSNPLDRIPMTAFDRLRAEAAIRRGEYIAELMLEALAAVRGLFGSVNKPQAPVARRLGPTG
ncbi:MAG: hypothetical protein K2X06_01400 [Burkholderiales bacterium]|nr:hypothetical protein [Burkholderiales bacterium]